MVNVVVLVMISKRRPLPSTLVGSLVEKLKGVPFQSEWSKGVDRKGGVLLAREMSDFAARDRVCG